MNENRIRIIHEGSSWGKDVLYWMNRDQRVHDNWALIYALDLAEGKGGKVKVIFCLLPEFAGASQRHLNFMIEGLKETVRELGEYGIEFVLVSGSPSEKIPEFIYTQGSSFQALITDFSPLRGKRAWNRRIAAGVSIPFIEVDAHNIVPVWTASPKQEYAAYTIRPKIRRLLAEYLEDFPVLKKQGPRLKNQDAFIEKEFRKISYSDRGGAISRFDPGEGAAGKMLLNFIVNRLSRYSSEKNDPTKDAVSDLSPYFHFGQLSPQRAALAVLEADASGEDKDAFLEELIVRRELADNFCYYNPRYDSAEGFPPWAVKTLEAHRRDLREYQYSAEIFETGETHDPLWNAAQMEMVKLGKMHGYMRMYWGKKILEWSEGPEKAMETAVYLNDAYSLDGRDPNGYTGIAWSIGGVHDRPWFERAVFGKIRYMNFGGCKRKFNVEKYMETIKSL